MAQRGDFDKIELHLIRVLQTLITERSVSRAAMRLRSTQPAVSAQLKRLRALTGDPLLVRSGNGMTPTETALQLLDPASRLLQDADSLDAGVGHDQRALRIAQRLRKPCKRKRRGRTWRAGRLCTFAVARNRGEKLKCGQRTTSREAAPHAINR